MKWTVKKIATVVGATLVMVWFLMLLMTANKYRHSDRNLYAVTYFDGSISHTDFSDSIRFRDEKCIDYRAFPLKQWKKVCGQNIAVTDYFEK